MPGPGGRAPAGMPGPGGRAPAGMPGPGGRAPGGMPGPGGRAPGAGTPGPMGRAPAGGGTPGRAPGGGAPGPGRAPAGIGAPGRGAPGAGMPGPAGRAPGGGAAAGRACGAAGRGAPAAAAGAGGRRGVADELPHLVDEGPALEGLRDVAVGAGRAGARLVERLEGAGEEQHGDVAQGRIGLHRLAHLVAVLPGHHDVGQDHVRLELAGPRDRVLPVVDRGDLDVLVRERDPDDLLDRDRVVREKKVLGHGRVRPRRRG